MPSPKVFKLFQEKLGYPIPEATRRGDIAESLVKDLAGIPSGGALAIFCDPPANPLKHAQATDFLIMNGVAKRNPAGIDYGPLIKAVATLMADGDAGNAERERQRIDAEKIVSYGASGSSSGGASSSGSGGSPV